MALRKRLIVLGLLGLGAALLLALAAGLVFLRLANSQPVGTGESRPSPDQAHMAAVHEYVATDFWSGEKQHWFEFEVTGPGVAYHARTDPIPGPSFGSRSDHRVIFWSPTSRFVRFAFPAMNIVIEIPGDAPSLP